MYLVAMLLMAPVVLTWSSYGHLWQSGLAAAALVHAWLPLDYCEWNPPGWSLSAEAFFYLLFPLAIKAVSTQSRARMLGLLMLFWAASLTAPVLYAVHGSIERDFWMFNPVVRLPEFLLGVTAGVLWMRDERIRDVLPAYTAEISLAVLSGILCIPMNQGYVMNGACAPLILLMILDLATGRGPLARLLGTRLFVVLGGASYSLYIIHWPVWYEAKFVVGRLVPGLAPTTAFWLITLGVLIPASWVCFRFIEEPLNKRLRRQFASMSMPVPAATVDDVYDRTKGLS
jgi:peptidoglycan/LPS O-acetylase OafA/YrhL